MRIGSIRYLWPSASTRTPFFALRGNNNTTQMIVTSEYDSFYLSLSGKQEIQAGEDAPAIVRTRMGWGGGESAVFTIVRLTSTFASAHIFFYFFLTVAGHRGEWHVGFNSSFKVLSVSFTLSRVSEFFFLFTFTWVGYLFVKLCIEILLLK